MDVRKFLIFLHNFYPFLLVVFKFLDDLYTNPSTLKLLDLAIKRQKITSISLLSKVGIMISNYKFISKYKLHARYFLGAQ
jgi:hypothetical protein